MKKCLNYYKQFVINIYDGKKKKKKKNLYLPSVFMRVNTVGSYVESVDALSASFKVASSQHKGVKVISVFGGRLSPLVVHQDFFG